MATIDVRAMLLKKDREKNPGRLTVRDVNRSLIISLLAIPVYGKEARDEEILSVIINAGKVADTSGCMERIRASYDQMVKDKKIKKAKGGEIRDTDGFWVLEPRR